MVYLAKCRCISIGHGHDVPWVELYMQHQHMLGQKQSVGCKIKLIKKVGDDESKRDAEFLNLTLS